MLLENNAWFCRASLFTTFPDSSCCSVSALHSLWPINDLQFRHSILLRGHLLMTVCIVPIFPDTWHCEKPFTHFCVDFYISLLLGMSRNGIWRAYDNSEIAKLLYFSVYIPTNNVHFSVFPTHAPSIDSSVTVATLVWSAASLLWWLMTLRSF